MASKLTIEEACAGLGAAFGRSEAVVQRFAGVMAEHLPEHAPDDAVEAAANHWIRTERAFPSVADFRAQVLARCPERSYQGCPDCENTGWRTVLKAWVDGDGLEHRKSFACRCRCEKGQSHSEQIPFADAFAAACARRPGHLEVFVTDRRQLWVPNIVQFGEKRWMQMQREKPAGSREALHRMFREQLGKLPQQRQQQLNERRDWNETEDQGAWP